jgi:hypothetical protein
LRRLAHGDELAHQLTDRLRGSVIEVPAELGRTEFDEVVELCVLFLELQFVGEPDANARRRVGLFVHADTEREWVERIPGSVVIVRRGERAAPRALDVPIALTLLRDLVVDAVGRLDERDGVFGEAARCATEYTDTPATALRLMQGMLDRPQHGDDDAEARLARGLAGVIGWLLEGCPRRVARVAAALMLEGALGWRASGRLEAQIDGHDLDLARELAAGVRCGVVESVGEGEVYLHGVFLRRPLQACRDGRVEAAVVHRVAEFLRLRQGIGVEVVPLPTPPRLPREAFAGSGDFGPESEDAKRARELLEDVRDSLTLILIGSTREVVRVVNRALFSGEYDPAWISFWAGPEAAWTSLAIALDVDGTREPEDGMVPRWVARVQEILIQDGVVLVVQDAHEAHDAGWFLPAHQGARQFVITPNPRELPRTLRSEAIQIVLGHRDEVAPHEVRRRSVEQRVAACASITSHLVVRAVLADNAGEGDLAELLRLFRDGVLESLGTLAINRSTQTPTAFQCQAHARAVLSLRHALTPLARAEVYWDLHRVAERVIAAEIQLDEGASIDLARRLREAGGDRVRDRAAAREVLRRAHEAIPLEADRAAVELELRTLEAEAPPTRPVLPTSAPALVSQS